MDNELIIYIKRDSFGSIVHIVSNIFIDNIEEYEEIDRWTEGQERYLYAHANNGEYVKEKYGKSLFDEQNRPNFHDNFIEWTEEEKKEKYPLVNNEKTTQEEKLNNMILMSTRSTFLNELSDELAVEIPLMYTSWNDYEDGFEFTENKDRVEYNGKLWKCKKTHQKQVSWYPGADPTLFIQLDKDEHKGTLEDPIPVPDSVSTSGFEYIVGKYYLEGEDKYLCKRDGMEDGETIELFFMPSNLIGQYFEKVS